MVFSRFKLCEFERSKDLFAVPLAELVVPRTELIVPWTDPPLHSQYFKFTLTTYFVLKLVVIFKKSHLAAK